MRRNRSRRRSSRRSGRGLRSAFANDSMRAKGMRGGGIMLGRDQASRPPVTAGGIRGGRRRRGRGMRGGKWWETLLSAGAAVIPALL